MSDSQDHDSHLYFVEQEGQVIASLRQQIGGVHSIPAAVRSTFELAPVVAHHGESSFSVCSRLVVAKAFRGSLVTAALMLHAYQDLLERGLLFNFASCSPWLLSLYEQLGFLRYTRNFDYPVGGLQIPLALPLRDFEHLRSVRSPFVKIFRRRDDSQPLASWIRQSYSASDRFLHSHTTSDAELWRRVAEIVPQTPQEGPSLVQDMTPDELNSLRSFMAVHESRDGEILVSGCGGAQTLFILLTGAVEVELFPERSGRYAMPLGPGQVFGEFTFLDREFLSERAVALTNVQYLILSKDGLERASKRIPEVVAKLYCNLAHALSHRVRLLSRELAQDRSHPPNHAD